MFLKFPNHFQERITERNINIDDVKKAIKNPDTKKPAYSGKIMVTKKIEKRTIKVIYCKDGFKDKTNQYIIITAYYI